MVMSDTTAVTFSVSIIMLPHGGRSRTSAWGRMTRRMRCAGDMLRAIAASYWGFGTARIAPRTASAP